MPPKAVLGLGLVRGGKALAGDWGLLKAELRGVVKPCMFCVWVVAEPPRLREPIAVRGSTCITQRRIHSDIIAAKTRFLKSLLTQSWYSDTANSYRGNSIQAAGAGCPALRHDSWWRLASLVHHIATVGHHGQDCLRQLLRHTPNTLKTNHKGHRSNDAPKHFHLKDPPD